MIPKTIHYCWFGPKNKPNSFKRYLRTWKRVMPDYEIKEWNEQSFDVNSISFTSEAYRCGKYAFVSDYVRLLALHQEGGIYLDTDVEVLKSFDELLDLPAFIGYDDQAICTAVIGSEKGNPFISECLECYDRMSFDKDHMIPNPKVLATVFEKHGYVLDFKKGLLDNVLHVFPIDYFAVKAFKDLSLHLSENSFSIHHYAASWFTPIGRVYRRFLGLIGPTGRKFFFRFVDFIKGR